MKALLFVTLLWVGLPAQKVAAETEETVPEAGTFLVSCQHPVMEKARQEGLTALKLKEVPLFLAMSVRCKLQARQEGVDAPMGQLFKDKQSTRHEEAKNFSGLGSCCARVTGIILLYAYLGLIFDTWK